VVTLICGHDPAALARSLHSWAVSGVREVIVLAGPDDEQCHRVLEQFAITVIRRRGDPRHDLRAGWSAATSTYVALAEPGTVWAPDAAEQVLGVFSGAARAGVVSAVAVRQNVIVAGWGRGRARERFRAGVLERTGDMTLDLRTFGAAAAGSRLEGAVTGAWAGTAVFRRDALIAAEHDFLQMTCATAGLSARAAAAVLAERLAELVLAAGDSTVLQPRARVWRMADRRSPSTGSRRRTWPQPLRDAFASGRSSWPLVRRGVLGPMARRRPYRAACLLGGVLAGPQALLLLGYVAVPAFAGSWQASATLGGWILFTRGVLLLPHLRRHPWHVILVPIHLASTGSRNIARSAGYVAGMVRGFVDAEAAERESVAAAEPAPDPALRLLALQPPPLPGGTPEPAQFHGPVPLARTAPVASKDPVAGKDPVASKAPVAAEVPLARESQRA
jgi:hypothetical protein